MGSYDASEEDEAKRDEYEEIEERIESLQLKIQKLEKSLHRIEDEWNAEKGCACRLHRMACDHGGRS